QAGGKSCEGAKIGCLRSRPQAAFICVRGPPALLFPPMSSFSRLAPAAGGPLGPHGASSEGRRRPARGGLAAFGVAVMSAARPLFHRKRKSIRNLAMSQKCHKRL